MAYNYDSSSQTFYNIELNINIEIYCLSIKVYIDSDGDKLGDTWEICYLGSLARSSGGTDIDRDNLKDAEEFLFGTNPNNSDTDGDLIRDDLDYTYFDPLVWNDPNGDIDNDGLTNLEECQHDNDPNIDPAIWNDDPDHDGLTSIEEKQLGSNPFNQLDIFIEVTLDHRVADNHGLDIDLNFFEPVIDAFSVKGINLHIDIETIESIDNVNKICLDTANPINRDYANTHVYMLIADVIYLDAQGNENAYVGGRTEWHYGGIVYANANIDQLDGTYEEYIRCTFMHEFAHCIGVLRYDGVNEHYCTIETCVMSTAMDWDHETYSICGDCWAVWLNRPAADTYVLSEKCSVNGEGGTTQPDWWY